MQKKSIDTIYFKATYCGLGKPANENELTKLACQRVINKRDYKSAVCFVPLGKKDTFYLPYKDVDKIIIETLLNFSKSETLKICIKAVVFKKYKFIKSKTFFL